MRHCRSAFAWIGTAFVKADAPAGHARWRRVADQLRSKVPRLAKPRDAVGSDVLAHRDVPRERRARIHSSDPTERLNGEIKRRTDVVGMFPNEAVLTRLIGAILLEQSDEWATRQSRYIILEAIHTASDTAPVSLPALAK
ncbi:hypothetical protein GCM10011504_46070 [Siccirubricoccus deserti]|uniref:Mutator family transposase n=1 Tax=Siccirubricoccus deserti TaxID=2013562 RepID=A0A9X0R232_9PROT|nr:transposase [Siccirubricoccus deserti]GGC62669.1 hypothetical protein GCM10011504_46070 [Siccirubricoccus deserti]